MYYTPIEAFAAGDDVIVPDSDVVYTEDHPMVRAYPSKFKPLIVLGRGGHPVVEQATDAPGEKRTTRR